MPKLKLVDSYVTSTGFPIRLKIEVYDHSTFKSSVVYEDYTPKDFKVGKSRDIEVGQRYFQENYRLKQSANKDTEAIWF